MNPIINKRFTIKAFDQKGTRPLELAHPENMKLHPWAYMELPLDPEYSLYNNRMTPEYLNNITPDEQYWAVRTGVILRNTGEFPVEIAGPDALKFANYVFTRNIEKIHSGRCSYQFACYHDGGMITDGVMLHFNKKKLWMAQADGDLFNWYLANAKDFDVQVTDPNVWVSQIQGPNSMKFLASLIDDKLPEPWNYFDMGKVIIAGEEVIISRTGFSNELGWEIYLTPENDTLKIGKKLWEIGKNFDLRLTGTPVFRARRIEAGLLSAGRDFNRYTNPFEVGLGKFMDMNKGNFIGRESLLGVDKSTKISGMRVPDGIAKIGKSIFFEDQLIGEVTSSSWSPYQDCGVSIIRFYEANLSKGLVLDVLDNQNKNLKGYICELPMYDEKGEIVRGIKAKIPTEPSSWKPN